MSSSAPRSSTRPGRRISDRNSWLRPGFRSRTAAERCPCRRTCTGSESFPPRKTRNSRCGLPSAPPSRPTRVREQAGVVPRSLLRLRRARRRQRLGNSHLPPAFLLLFPVFEGALAVDRRGLRTLVVFAQFFFGCLPGFLLFHLRHAETILAPCHSEERSDEESASVG